MKTVAKVMTREPVKIQPGDPIRKALELMREGGFRRLPVVEEGRLVGILSDRDLREVMNAPVILHEKKYDDYILDNAMVGACMTTEVQTLSPNDSLEKAAKLMRDGKVGGLPVMEGGQVVGIITESDLLDYLIQMLETERLSSNWKSFL